VTLKINPTSKTYEMIEKKVESITKAYNDVVEETSKTIFQVRKFLGLWKNKLYLL